MLRHTARFSALILIASLALFALACGGSSSTVPDQPVTEAQPQQSRTIVLYQYRFNPNTISVPAGTTIIFQNRDPESHNLNIPALNIDQNIEPNQEWSYTFSTRGEFAVGNRFSDGMRLDIVVQ